MNGCERTIEIDAAEGAELRSTLDTVIAIVTERLACLRAVFGPAPESDGESGDYYRTRLGLAFLLGLRNRLP